MADLHANDAEIALSLSLFIVTQGAVPLLWAAISEVKGRRVSVKYFLVNEESNSSDLRLFISWP